MQFYFFKSIDKEHSKSFGQFTNKQNVITTKILSLIVIGICACIRVSNIFIGYQNHIANIAEYRRAGNFIIASSLTCFFMFPIIKKLVYRKRHYGYKILTLVYAACLITGCMWVTLVARHNPSNTMSMFLIGMACVSVLWILKLREISTITIVTGIIFFAGTNYYVTEPMQIYTNYLVGFCVLTLFFAISRIVFSYHYNYFVEVKNVEKKKDEIGKINMQQTEILNIVAHDMRSPINSIAGLVEILKTTPTTETERQEYYDMILASCRHTDHIVHDLIEDVKKSAQGALELEPVMLNEFLEKVLERWSARLQDTRGIVYNSQNTPLYVNINMAKFSRVLDNLISNARKFTADKGTIQIILTHSTGRAKISITDDGIGVPESLQPFLFHRFSRAGRKGLNGEQSYGLGLSICKQIVEQHHGIIFFDGDGANGTSFHIELPLVNHPVVVPGQKTEMKETPVNSFNQ